MLPGVDPPRPRILGDPVASHLRRLAQAAQASESIDSLKKRAERAIPWLQAGVASKDRDGTDQKWVGNRESGTTVEKRNFLYSTMPNLLLDDWGRYWFAAAAKVTGSGGIRFMNDTMAQVFGPLQEATRSFLDGLNAFLFPHNLFTYYALRARREIWGLEGLGGFALDRALVVLEQTLVQRFIESYFAKPDMAEHRREIVENVSSATYSFFADSDIKTILKATFGKSFDFGNIDHRITFGIAIVRRMRSRSP